MRGRVPPDREKAIKLPRRAIRVYFVHQDSAFRSQPDVHETTTRTSIREKLGMLHRTRLPAGGVATFSGG